MSEHGGGGGEHKVKAVLNIGGEISSTLKSSFNLVTGNIFKIGTAADKAIRHGFRKDIEDGNKSVKALNSEIKKTGDVTGDLTRQMGALVRKIDETKSIQNLYHGVGNSAGKFARGLGVVTVEATATGWAIYHLTEKYEDYLKTVRVGAKEADMTPQAFAKMKYAAGDQLEAVLKARALFSAAHLTNSKKYQASMKMIGLSNRDLKGLDLNDAFLKVGDAIKKFKGDRLGISKALFGRGGPAALPFIMRGSEENKKRMAMAEKMGLAPTEEDMKKNAEYAWSMTKLGMAVDSAKFSIGKAFLPVVEELGDTLSEFMVEHHDDFQKWADELGKAVKDNMPKIKDLAGTFHKLSDFIEFASHHTTALKYAFVGLFTLPFLPFIASLATIGASLNLMTNGAIASGIFRIVTGLWGMSAGATAAAGGLLSMSIVLTSILAIGLSLVKCFDEIHSNWDVWGDASAWKGMAKNLVGLGPKEGQITKEEIEAARKKHQEDRLKNYETPADANNPLPTRRKGYVPSAAPFGSPGPAHGRKGSLNQTNHVTIHVHPTPGMDTHAVANLIMSRMGGMQAALAGGHLYDS